MTHKTHNFTPFPPQLRPQMAAEQPLLRQDEFLVLPDLVALGPITVENARR